MSPREWVEKSISQEHTVRSVAPQRFGSPPPSSFDVRPTEDDVAFFAENGFLVVERLTTDEELTWLERVFDAVMSEVPRVFEPGRDGHDEGPPQIQQLIAPEVEFPELLETTYLRNARHFAAALLEVREADLVSWGHMIVKPPRRSRVAPWHQDEAYWQPELDYHAVGAWLPLHEVTVERGAMQFIPGSHKGPLLEHHHMGDPAGNLLEADGVEPSRAQPCPLPAGGATFHHHRTLHYTASNTTDLPRKAFPMELRWPRAAAPKPGARRGSTSFERRREPRDFLSPTSPTGASSPSRDGAVGHPRIRYCRYLMEYRTLGHSGLRVSTVSLGSWLTYGNAIDDDSARACLRRAFDLGVNLIDTANAYATGGAESFLGDQLKDVPRDDYVLATKVFFPMSEEDQGLSATQIRKQLDASLQRLRVDHIDLYQCHRYDPDVPLDETMTALTDAVASGKVRAIGFSEWSPQQVQDAIDLPDVARFTSSQPMYNAVWRRPERKLIPLCAANGIGQIVFSPLAQGVLTGKYKPGAPPPADSRLAHDEMSATMGFLATDPILEGVQRLNAVAEEAGLTTAQLALAWVLREPNVASAITGATRPSQVEENVAASGIVLDDDMVRAIDDALGDAVM